jgi:anionic cell wall polymer biosynthesis LytR-Cps2A-Psr (LCP) family protein
MYYGGPTGVVAEVEDLTGIHIDYYALTSFWNFRSLVHDIGGVDVDIPYPMKDSYSKANFKKGEQHLSGKQALAFARNRHDPPGGDFGRSFNCGTLLISFLRDFQEDFKQTPASVLSWLGAGLRNTRTDVPKDELLQLAFLASQIPVKNVNNFVVPGSTGMEGSESVVHLSSSAKSMYADLAKDGFIKEK